MGLWQTYRLRLERKARRVRALRKSFELRSVVDRTAQIQSGDLLLASTQRNENIRLPHFLQYYRNLGINHFLFVDNDSDDGSGDYLAEQPDVSLWHTSASYKSARFGVDWLNHLCWRYAHNHWVLTVDPDELLVFPFCDTRPLRALTDWFEASSIKSFSAMLLDLYPRGPIAAARYTRGDDPLQTTNWFDPGNYTIKRNFYFDNLWIQGGPRARVFFKDAPDYAPALNKIPLVKWHRRYAYVSSTHMLLPRGLNHVYDAWGGEKTSGVLLHTKFLNTFASKAQEELTRRQHYAGSVEYMAYAKTARSDPNLWCAWSEKYTNWRQLEHLGLMSKGNWA